MNIDSWRKVHMGFAELVDAWRLVPRAIVLAYAIMMWKVVEWYMNLQPKMIEGCDVKLLAEACLSQAPSTQHAALVTAVVGVAAAVFGLYSSSGKQWNTGIVYWDKKSDAPTKSDGES